MVPKEQFSSEKIKLARSLMTNILTIETFFSKMKEWFLENFTSYLLNIDLPPQFNVNPFFPIYKGIFVCFVSYLSP